VGDYVDMHLTCSVISPPLEHFKVMHKPRADNFSEIIVRDREVSYVFGTRIQCAYLGYCLLLPRMKTLS
jgi:hypothetical protein